MYSFYIARVFTGITCVYASALALRLGAPPGQPWLLFCLCLPEVIGLFGSLNQDGPLIACVVLACALLTRVTGSQAVWQPIDMTFAVALLALVVSAKPPYLPVLFLPLALVPGGYFKATLILVLVALAAFVAWCIFGLHSLVTQMRPGDISPARQLHNMLTHPGIILVVLYKTFVGGGVWLIENGIATIGWGEARMPNWFYAVISMIGLLLAGLYATLLLNAQTLSTILRLGLLGLLVIGATAGVTLSIYLTWDEVGRDSVWGLQGRYFIPLLVCLTSGAAFAGQGWLVNRAVPALNRVLLYGVLPSSGVCYLGVLFLRFWWPA